MELQELFSKYKGEPKTFIDGMAAEWGGDKGSTHSYIPIYQQLFESMRNANIALLEIGVMYGASIQMWKEYFPHGNIYGMDIRPHCTKYAEDRIKIFINDATKVLPTQNVLDKENLKFDIIIDDGSHQIQDQLDTLGILYPYLKAGGIYVIEDIQDINTQAQYFQSLGIPIEIVDLRSVKGRYDDVLIIIKK